jgi:putative transcriptional regulator
MGEFDALCHLDVHEMPPQQIKLLREQAHLSQAVFAAVLNTSLSTVQKWEVGDKKPSGPSLKLLNLIERKGLEAVL